LVCKNSLIIKLFLLFTIVEKMGIGFGYPSSVVKLAKAGVIIGNYSHG